VIALLTGRATDAASPLLAAHVARLAALPPFTARAASLPALLHLSAVRLIGADPLAEARAFVLWQRATEALSKMGTLP
jgi:hypothetical protein